MGAAFGRAERPPPRGFYRLPEPRIRGSNWCNEEELMILAKHTSEVSFIPSGMPRQGIDWSGLVQERFSHLREAGRISGSDWLDSILTCASSMAKIGAAEKPLMSPGAGGGSSLIVLEHKLEAISSILRINGATQEMLEKLLCKHPVVTSVRCIQRKFSAYDDLKDFSAKAGFNPYPWYNGQYDLDCIPRCAVLVGYDWKFWTIFDPTWNTVYNAVKSRSDLHTGVGELVLMPIINVDNA